ncbi:MAG: prolipoprotein diacylglyceryl transferase [Verrucomicrobiales bacterium]|nr:prolipoprotein diacylglyceryl transferase [Verrucomicrobiales bacterium]
MHKIALELGSFTIHWYGVFVGLGCLMGLWTASRRGLLDRFAPDKAYDVGLWILLGALIGARTLYVTSYWEEEFASKSWLAVLNIRQGGLVFYGGFIGSCLAVILYCWLKREPLWRLADMLAPSISLGSAFGRIGCLMTGCCYGKACSLPWGIHFPSDHPTFGTSVHPTQIYDSLINLAVYGGLEYAYRHKRFDGQIFALWLILYPIARSLTELFRGDYPQRYIGGILTPAQLLSVGILAVGVVLYRFLPRRLSRVAPPTPASASR